MAPRSKPILRHNMIAAAGHPKLEQDDETRRYDFSEMSKALPGPELTIKKRSNPILRRNVIAAAGHHKLEPSVPDEKANESRRYDFSEMSKALSEPELTMIKGRRHRILCRNVMATAGYRKSEPSADQDDEANEARRRRYEIFEMREYRLETMRRMRYLELLYARCERAKARRCRLLGNMITAGETVATLPNWRRQAWPGAETESKDHVVSQL